MGHLREVELGSSYPACELLREYFGFVPNLFRAQSLLPRTVEAEAALFAALLAPRGPLSRIQKEHILLAVAAERRDPYCTALHYQTLSVLGVPEDRLLKAIGDRRRAGLAEADGALLDFAVRLATPGVTACFVPGRTAEMGLEAVLTAAWANFLCTLSSGLGAQPDFEPPPLPAAGPVPASDEAGDGARPLFSAAGPPPGDSPALVCLREQFGFVPSLFQAQRLRPDLIEAEAALMTALLLTGEHLARRRKELILLVVSEVNGSVSWASLQTELLSCLGVRPEECDEIAVNHRQSRLPDADKALLDCAVELSARPAGFGAQNLDLLRRHGFSDEQILETIAVTAWGRFLSTLEVGLGIAPDFPLRREPSKIVHPFAAEPRLSVGSVPADLDAEAVARVRAGEVDAFEELIHRHSRRVYRTLVGILGNPEEARDAMQDTFLKAFQHLGDFQGRAKFSTWLVSIASNTGLQLLRERKDARSLDDDPFDSEEGFRPREVRAWADDPEQLYSKAETRALVEASVLRLPAKYRAVLVLRDMEQLPADEAAAALGLGLPALKARLLRGRLMLREVLAPHFSGVAKGGSA